VMHQAGGPGEANQITVIDTSSNALTATIPMSTFPQWLAVNPQGKRLYVALGSTASVAVIDTGTNQKLFEFVLQPGAFPTGIAVSPDGSRIFHIVGKVPKYDHESDGVVMVDWATLEGNVPSEFIDDPLANHLNLGAVFNWVGFLARGFRLTDDIWKRVVDIAHTYITQESLNASSRTAETRQTL